MPRLRGMQPMQARLLILGLLLLTMSVAPHFLAREPSAQASVPASRSQQSPMPSAERLGRLRTAQIDPRCWRCRGECGQRCQSVPPSERTDCFRRCDEQCAQYCP